MRPCLSQDYINIELDSHRNQLIQLELLLTAAMFAMALVTVVAGLFGMNLYNKAENSYVAFILVRCTVLRLTKTRYKRPSLATLSRTCLPGCVDSLSAVACQAAQSSTVTGSCTFLPADMSTTVPHAALGDRTSKRPANVNR